MDGGHKDADYAWNISFQKLNVSTILEYILIRHTIKIKNYVVLVSSVQMILWSGKINKSVVINDAVAEKNNTNKMKMKCYVKNVCLFDIVIWSHCKWRNQFVSIFFSKAKKTNQN